jgi:hypothetical protein
MNGKRILIFSINCAVLYGLLLAQAKNSGATSNLLMMITPVLSSGSSTIIDKKIPSLALMAAKDTDKIEIAWVPGSDGKTPVEQIKYEIHLSKTENFTPSAATLKKTVTGTSQTEIQGLESNTFYYGKIIAVYSASASSPSNQLQSKTYKNPVQLDSSATVAVAADLGLGKYTASGTIYTYTGTGTPPKVGSILFSEDAAGGMTMRTVDSASRSGSAVTVQTSDAALTDAIDRGSISNSFQLFDVAAQAASLPVSSSRIASAQNFASVDGSQHNRMEWKDRLLTAEQTNYAYNEEDFSVIPQGRTSVIKLSEANAVEESFTASVEAKFQPTLITEAEWGGFIFKTLDSAKVAAKGTLSLTALAQYNFSASGSVNKDFQLWKRTWVSVYSAGPVPVYQEITLYMNVAASASASAEIEAMAKAQIAEIVEVGATYNGVTWTPYITHNESKTLAASLDIAGKANAEIRLIPKIEVKFYKVASASLTIEPLAKSSLTVDKTTSNVDFLAAHPERLVQLTSFDASLGMESKVAVTFAALGYSWDALPSTCVLGTGSCLVTFNPLPLFSIPQLKLSYSLPTSGTQIDLKLQATDGVNNPFNPASMNWEAFPADGTLTPISCVKSEKTTTCTAIFEPGAKDKYTIFASGYSLLLEPSRQFKEMTLGSCALKPKTVIWKGQEWQHCNDGEYYDWEGAKAYCQNLVLDSHSDWRLPTKDELKGLVVCTNGTPTPLKDSIGRDQYPRRCDDGNSAPYRVPTIEPSFECVVYKDDWDGWWTSTVYKEPPETLFTEIWGVGFTVGSGMSIPLDSPGEFGYVRCVR